MNNTSSKTNRVFLICSVLFIAITAAPLYKFGHPWFKYHQDNLVSYDCRLQSESFPVGAKYAGRVDEIFVQVGQRVRAGDTIARMDSDELDARVERASAAIKLAQANVIAEKVAIEKALETMAAQQNCLEAKTNLATSRFDAVKLETKWIEKQVNRAQILARRRSVSESELEQNLREMQSFESKAKIASEEDLIARLDLAAIKSKIEEIKARKAKLTVFEQEVEISKTELAAVMEQKSAAVIKAKNDGIITHIFRGAGSSLKLGDPIVQIQSDDVWCEAWLDETKLPDVNIGSYVSIHLKAYNDNELVGTVKSFLPTPANSERIPQNTDNPILQPNSKICVKIEFSNLPNFELMPGLTGTAAIQKRRNPNRNLASSSPEQNTFVSVNKTK